MKSSLSAVTASIAPAIERLKRPDGVLLVPTETVYGLVCDADSETARAKIYEMKRRPSSKLLTLFVDSTDTMAKMIPDLPEAAHLLAAKFCPGPLTMIVPDGEGYTGFRIPNHPFLLALLKQYARPLASTSANLSGQPPAHTTQEALSTLAIPPDLTIDGGIIDAKSEPSTVLKIEKDSSWTILRAGPITEEMIRQTLRPLNTVQ